MYYHIFQVEYDVSMNNALKMRIEKFKDRGLFDEQENGIETQEE